MPSPSPQTDELRRLATLGHYSILDTPREAIFDDLVALAAEVCATPMAMLSFVDGERAWVKAARGPIPAQIPRAGSLCNQALFADECLILPDTRQDSCFTDTPLIKDEPFARFYAAVPICAEDGAPLGVMAVLDRNPRELSLAQKSALRIVGHQVEAQLELRRGRSSPISDPAHSPINRLGDILTQMTDACFALNPDWVFTFVNRRAETLLRHRADEMIGHSIWQVFGKLVGTPMEQHYRRAMEERIPVSFEAFSPIAERWLNIRLFPTTEGLGAFLLDIHDRKVAEAALVHSEEQIHAIVEHMTEGLVVAHPDGKLIRWNPAALQMHGFSNDDEWCRALTDFQSVFELYTLNNELLSFEQWPMVRLLRGEELKGCELRIKRAGTDWERIFRYNGAIVREPSGGELAFLTISDITARETAEEQLRTSLKENFDLRAALDEHAIVATTDARGRITFVNDKFCAISKYSREELLGQDHRIINSGHHSKAFMRGLWDTIRSGRVWHGEIRNRAKDGGYYWVDTTIVPFLHHNGEIRQYVAIRADITERKQAEESLETNQRFLSEVIERSGSLIFVKARDGRYQLVNRRWEEITNISRAEALGRTDSELFSASDAAKFRFNDLAIMDSEESQMFEERLVKDDGTHDFLSSKFPLRDAGGKIIGICGMSTEITERKAAERKVREQAELLDKAQDAILVRSLDHSILYWNKSAERLYGWTAKEVVGASVKELLYRDSSAFVAATEAALVKGEWMGEIEQITKDGRSLVVEGRWTLVLDDQGKPKSILAINTDLTERKKLEQQFLRAQRMESIGTLAGGIAHDLNNVLGPIIMSLELLKMRFPDSESLELVSVISSSAERGADMVRQVLSFARGVAGQRLEVQIRHLVRDIEKIINETFLKNVRISSGIPNDLWTVIGDATQLHQVLLNLCVNARDAMLQGGLLTISAENIMLDAQYAALDVEAVPGPYVCLQVEDTGTGIPPEILEKIFDPFFTTKEVGKGTGLGLSTTLAIIKSHGGFVRVYSEVGRGTRFKIYLPAATESTGHAEAATTAELPRGNGECILVVDDEASVRQITQQTLQAFGYRVTVACDGAEALAVYVQRSSEIAAVLTDMMMPVMDGPALIQVLQRMTPGIPIIAASGLAANAHVARVTNLGVKHFIPKPYTAETLLKTLRCVLEAAKGNWAPGLAGVVEGGHPTN